MQLCDSVVHSQRLTHILGMYRQGCVPMRHQPVCPLAPAIFAAEEVLASAVAEWVLTYPTTLDHGYSSEVPATYTLLSAGCGVYP